MEKRTASLAKNTLILTIGNLCTKGIMFIITPLLTRWLSTQDYGTFDLLITYKSLIIPIVTLQVGEAAFRQLLDEKSIEEKKKVICNASSIYAIALGINVILTLTIAYLGSGKKSYIWAFGIIVAGETVYSYLGLLLRGFKRLDLFAYSNIIFVFMMSFSAFVYIKLLEMKLTGVLLAYATGYFVSSLYMLCSGKLVKYIVPLKLEGKQVCALLKYSIPLMPDAISWWIVSVSDRTIISFVIGSSANAIYAVASKIPNLVQNTYNLFNLSWQQNATEVVDDDDRDTYYNNILNRMFVFVVSIICLILSINFILFMFVFEEEYYLAFYIVPILSVAVIFTMLAQFLGSIYIAQKETKRSGITTLVAACINILVNVVLIHKMGVFAAATSTVVSYFVLFLIRYIDIRRTIKLKLDGRSFMSMGLLSVFVVLVYINNDMINIMMLLISGIYVLYVNRGMISLAINRTMGKLNKD